MAKSIAHDINQVRENRPRHAVPELVKRLSRFTEMRGLE
jgi:hypothetical protein